MLAWGLACAPLERMLLFSSVSAALGNAGQAAYSGANAALDCAAADLQSQVFSWLKLMQWTDRPGIKSSPPADWRRLLSQGTACVAVGWGAWAGGGMAGRDMQLLQRLHRQGTCGAVHKAPAQSGTFVMYLLSILGPQCRSGGAGA